MLTFRSILVGTFALALISTLANATEEVSDPYAHVHSIKLKNGLKAVLAPSDTAKTFQIKVRVGGGIYNEVPGKAGVAHLLEHYLFTDAKLEKDMTFLEVIKEKGGSGNASTQPKETEYHATVPSHLAPWVVETFSKIVFEKSFEEERVQHAKGPVFLEIGRPSIFDYVTLVIQKLWPDFARPQDFWQTEFGIREPMMTVSAPRLQTEALTSQDLKRFYEREYYPSNITVFVAGNFSEKNLVPLLEKTFGNVPDRRGDGWVDPTPHARHGNYFRSQVTSNVPHIEVGTKVANITLEDETVGRMYVEYLSHRLMKDLRNLRAETYTVRENVDLRKGSGYFTVEFEAPREDYHQNLNFVKDMIDRETRQGQFTEAMFNEARDLYAKGFQRIDHDSGTMMYLASRMDYIEHEYSMQSSHTNDYQAFKNLTYPEFSRRLKALFAPDMRAEDLNEPPLFFRFESVVLAFLAFAFWMRTTRTIFVKRFAHDQIRWVRKVSYPPAYILQLTALSMIALTATLISGAMTVLWYKVPLLQRSFITSEYLSTVLWIGAVLIVSQSVLGLFARKLMVVGDSVWIKSISYRSSTFKLMDIESVELRSPFAVLFSPKLLNKFKHRYAYYDACFWKKGLLIQLKNGSTYFVGISSAKASVNELNSLLKVTSSEPQPQPDPQKTESPRVA